MWLILKNVKAPKQINLSEFVHCFNILILNLITLCIDFVSFPKGQIFKELKIKIRSVLREALFRKKNA